MKSKRILTTYLTVFLFISSCQNSRIKDLEAENKSLQEKYNKLLKYKGDSAFNLYQEAKKAIADSIIFDKSDERYNTMLCGWTKLFAYNSVKTCRVNEEYKSNYTITDLGSDNYFSVKFTNPTKKRTEYSFKNNYIKSNGKELNFKPKDIGLYYWTGQLIVKNPRTGQLTYFPINDSIVVY